MTDRMSLTMLEQASEKPIKWADSIIVRRKGSMSIANIFDVFSGEIWPTGGEEAGLDDAEAKLL